MTALNRILSLFIPFLFLSLFFVACEDSSDDFSDNLPDGNSFTNQVDSTVYSDCFTFSYPIQVVLEDSSVVTINDANELLDALEDEVNEVEDLVYPVLVTLTTDNSTVTVNHEDQIEDILEACYGEDWDDDDYDDNDDDDDYDDSSDGDDYFEQGLDFSSCFSINYPVQLVLEDSSIISVNSDTELFDAFSEDGNPNEVEDFVYPVSVTLTADNSTVTVNHEDQIEDILEACYGDGWDDDDDDDDDNDDDNYDLDDYLEQGIDFSSCFSINYPLQLVLEDGSIISVNSDTELFDAFSEDGNPNEVEDFVYPVSITLTADNSIITVNNEDDIEDVIEACF